MSEAYALAWQEEDHAELPVKLSAEGRVSPHVLGPMLLRMSVRPPRDTKLAQFLALLDIAEAVEKASDALEDAERRQSLAWIQGCRDLAHGKPRIAAASLRSLQRDFLVRWNEGVGPDVEAFWERVAQAGIPVERQRDIVAETLKSGRIANMQDFVAIEDTFELLQTSGKVTEAQAHELNRMLDAFADAPENQQFFEDSDEPVDAADEPSSQPDATVFHVEIGQLVRVSAREFRYDYFGTELAAVLQKKGYQGGGDSWAGIASGLLRSLQPDVLPRVRMDPEAGCLSIWASEPEPLQIVAALIARAVRERPLLMRAIKEAEARAEME